MPQLVLPVFPEGATMISTSVAIERRDGKIFYFHGQLPVFSHPEDDLKSFRMFTSQLVVNGNCKQVDIIRTFGVPPITVKRTVKLYREKGPAGFYEQKPRKRNPRVLTPKILEKAQSLLDDRVSRSEVAERLSIKPDTLYKAIRFGKLIERSFEEKKTKVTGA